MGPPARPRAGRLPWAVCGVVLARAAAGLPAGRVSIAVPLRRARPALAPPPAALVAEAVNLSSGTHSEVLRNVGEVQYIGALLIGSPGQQVEVIFDTGSSDLWLFSTVFDPAASSTARRGSGDVSITYGQGSVRGRVTLDDVALEGMAAVAGQPVITLDQSSGMQHIVSGGVFGLGLPGLCHTGETFLQRLREQQGISKFTLLLTGDEYGSQLVFGEPDPKWYGGPDEIIWVPVFGERWWLFGAELGVDTWRAGGVDTKYQGLVMLDSGTSYLAASAADVEILLRSLIPDPQQLARCQKKSGQPVEILLCPCDIAAHMNDFVVHINDGSRSLTITLVPELLLGAIDEALQTCALQLQATPPGLPFILGDTFLRQVAVVFDTENNRMGIGPRPWTGRAARHAPQIGSLGAGQDARMKQLLYVLWACLVLLTLWLCRSVAVARSVPLAPGGVPELARGEQQVVFELQTDARGAPLTRLVPRLGLLAVALVLVALAVMLRGLDVAPRPAESGPAGAALEPRGALLLALRGALLLLACAPLLLCGCPCRACWHREAPAAPGLQQGLLATPGQQEPAPAAPPGAPLAARPEPAPAPALA